RSAREKAEVYLLRVNLESSRGENLRALANGREGLALLGLHLPTRGSQLAVVSRLAAVPLRLVGRGVDELAALPASDDPDRRLILQPLMAVAPPAYMVDTNLMAWIGLRMVAESLSHGVSAPSAYGFLALGILMAGVLGRYEYAQVCADVAEALFRRFPEPFLAARIDFVVPSY